MRIAQYIPATHDTSCVDPLDGDNRTKKDTAPTGQPPQHIFDNKRENTANAQFTRRKQEPSFLIDLFRSDDPGAWILAKKLKENSQSIRIGDRIRIDKKDMIVARPGNPRVVSSPKTRIGFIANKKNAREMAGDNRAGIITRVIIYHDDLMMDAGKREAE